MATSRWRPVDGAHRIESTGGYPLDGAWLIGRLKLGIGSLLRCVYMRKCELRVLLLIDRCLTFRAPAVFSSLMMRALLLLLGLGTSAALAIPPPPESFDGETIRCQVAGSAAAVLICRDAELTALDRQLRQAFRAALADPALQQSDRAALLREQEQWVIAMDQCWRAGEQLRACVKASQSQRLRLLQARPTTWQPAPAQP